jgi:hypothetical protein
MKLGDFSITYRVAGLLTEVKSLLSTRSKLQAKMADQLHQSGIEIVSPNFMNQRILEAERLFIPKTPPSARVADEHKELPETVVFDKADEAESLEKLRERQAELRAEIDQAKSDLSEAADDLSREKMRIRVESLETGLARLIEYIAQREGGEK